jgi:outer membrane protein OmpA-like peptidoglycan-associated protein
METRFQRDFSNIRVHSNSQEAEALGARAFAKGKDIALAPGESDADSPLLAHELTHTVQQAESGKAQVQMQPKDPDERKRGIGAEPPTEPFDRAQKQAPEDDAILFEFNDATISGAGRAILRKFAAAQKNPLLIEVHGYASSEGEAEYNFNLSAHRAAALKAALIDLLPKGSQVKLYAHGESKEFGKAESNRRAGFKATALPAAAPQSKSDAEWSVDPTGDTPKRDEHLDPAKSSVRLFPPLTLSPGPLLPPRMFTLSPLGQAGGTDWLALQTRWASYGLRLDPRMAADIEAYGLMQRNATTNFFVFLGMDAFSAAKLADTLQPIALGNATGAYLSNNYPNWVDITDREIQAAYPNAWKTPQVPINSVVDFIYRKASGKEKGSLFEF